MTEIMKMIPGLSRAMPDVDIDEREVGRVEAIICSMTARERRYPQILNASRRRRIALGSGAQSRTSTGSSSGSKRPVT